MVVVRVGECGDQYDARLVRLVGLADHRCTGSLEPFEVGILPVHSMRPQRMAGSGALAFRSPP